MTLTVPSSDAPEVVVAVIATRDAERLERCLRAISDAGTDGLAVQTVLCDNAAQPDVRELISRVEGAVVMRSRVDLGTAATWNRALDAVVAPRFATVHEDAFVEPGWLGVLSRALDADPLVAIAGPTVLDTSGNVHDQGAIVFRSGVPLPMGAKFAPGLEPLTTITPVDEVSSSTMLADRSLWEEVGGYDEGTYPGVTTDVDLSVAAWAAGRRVVTVPAARTVHAVGAAVVPGAGWNRSPAFREFLLVRNCARFHERWASFLPDHIEHPGRTPDPDAFRAGLARARAAAENPQRLVDGWPSRERVLTLGAAPSLDAPPEVEARAVELLAARRDDFTEWLTADQERLRAELAILVDHTADLTERSRVAVEVITAQRADVQELLDERAAREQTLTWRMRERLLRLPGVAAAMRRRR